MDTLGYTEYGYFATYDLLERSDADLQQAAFAQMQELRSGKPPEDLLDTERLLGHISFEMVMRRRRSSQLPSQCMPSVAESLLITDPAQVPKSISELAASGENDS